MRNIIGLILCSLYPLLQIVHGQYSRFKTHILLAKIAEYGAGTSSTRWLIRPSLFWASDPCLLTPSNISPRFACQTDSWVCGSWQSNDDDDDAVFTGIVLISWGRMIDELEAILSGHYQWDADLEATIGTILHPSKAMPGLSPWLIQKLWAGLILTST